VRRCALLYHDVVAPGRDDDSGFPGGAAGRYKLVRDEFERHLDALAAATGRPPVRVDALREAGDGMPWLLTFDDGGASARPVGERLAERGWPAHFFVTADRSGTRAFLGRDDVRALAALGHVIGSHSCSHPSDMARAPRAALLSEWTRSAAVLADLIGDPVRVASVPAGSYAPRVAEAASAAGLAVLFNSEPVTRARTVDGCLVLGRYTLRRGSSARAAARLAGGAAGARGVQLAAWQIKKAVRRMAGTGYERMRHRVLD
jgi:peptidoglycan/xylan/chitin deacetylase (PgdA/CDA1 family)